MKRVIEALRLRLKSPSNNKILAMKSKIFGPFTFVILRFPCRRNKFPPPSSIILISRDCPLYHSFIHPSQKTIIYLAHSKNKEKILDVACLLVSLFPCFVCLTLTTGCSGLAYYSIYCYNSFSSFHWNRVPQNNETEMFIMGSC
jgi:hypothetical protein